MLLALAEGALHGAEIRRRVEDESGGGVTLYPAMLYGTLDELAEAGWIEEAVDRWADPDRGRWRFYALTPAGRQILETETMRLGAVVGRARAALGLDGA